MSTLDDIRAQDTAVRTLKRAADEQRLASAYLFQGPSGVGKQKAALALARYVIAQNPVDRSATDRDATSNCSARIDAGTHPDVRVFLPRNEGHRNINVETLREEILPVAQYAPFEACATFLIFPEADVSFPEIHPEGANAMLKTLEEARPGVHFLLLAERPDQLLPTIRSRCQSVRFQRLPASLIHEILAAHEVPEPERAAAIALADGRADRALTFAEQGLGKALVQEAIHIDQATQRPQPGTAVAAAERLAKHDHPQLLIETLQAFYRDIACAAAGVDELQWAFQGAKETVRQRAQELGPYGAASRVQLLEETVELLRRNANPQIMMDSVLFRLRSIV